MNIPIKRTDDGVPVNQTISIDLQDGQDARHIINGLNEELGNMMRKTLYTTKATGITTRSFAIPQADGYSLCIQVKSGNGYQIKVNLRWKLGRKQCEPPKFFERLALNKSQGFQNDEYLVEESIFQRGRDVTKLQDIELVRTAHGVPANQTFQVRLAEGYALHDLILCLRKHLGYLRRLNAYKSKLERGGQVYTYTSKKVFGKSLIVKIETKGSTFLSVKICWKRGKRMCEPPETFKKDESTKRPYMSSQRMLRVREELSKRSYDDVLASMNTSEPLDIFKIGRNKLWGLKYSMRKNKKSFLEFARENPHIVTQVDEFEENGERHFNAIITNKGLIHYLRSATCGDAPRALLADFADIRMGEVTLQVLASTMAYIVNRRTGAYKLFLGPCALTTNPCSKASTLLCSFIGNRHSLEVKSVVTPVLEENMDAIRILLRGKEPSWLKCYKFKRRQMREKLEAIGCSEESIEKQLTILFGEDLAIDHSTNEHDYIFGIKDQKRQEGIIGVDLEEELEARLAEAEGKLEPEFLLFIHRQRKSILRYYSRSAIDASGANFREWEVPSLDPLHRDINGMLKQRKMASWTSLAQRLHERQQQDLIAIVQSNYEGSEYAYIGPHSSSFYLSKDDQAELTEDQKRLHSLRFLEFLSGVDCKADWKMHGISEADFRAWLLEPGSFNVEELELTHLQQHPQVKEDQPVQLTRRRRKKKDLDLMVATQNTPEELELEQMFIHVEEILPERVDAGHLTETIILTAGPPEIPEHNGVMPQQHHHHHLVEHHSAAGVINEETAVIVQLPGSASLGGGEPTSALDQRPDDDEAAEVVLQRPHEDSLVLVETEAEVNTTASLDHVHNASDLHREFITFLQPGSMPPPFN